MRYMTKDSWAGFAVFGAMVGTFSLCLYLPQSRKLKSLKTEIAKCKLAIEGDARAASVVPALAKEVEAMRRRYKDFNRRLPEDVELGGFLKEISSNLTQKQLKTLRMEPGSPTREEFYHTLPIIMHLRGKYLSLGSFLSRIDNMERLTRVRKLEIVADKESDGQSLDIKLQMNIYFTESPAKSRQI